MPGVWLGARGGVRQWVGGDSEQDWAFGVSCPGAGGGLGPLWRKKRGGVGASGFEPEFSRSQSARVKPGYATPRSEHSTCDH